MSRLARLAGGAALWLVAVGAPAARAAVPPPVAADHAMVVSAHPLATQAGLDVLRGGGNVVDAAVAVGYALAVVYPAAGNLGGGGFMTVRFADGRTTFLDFREKAPMAATAGTFLDAAGQVVEGRSTNSWLAVGVPGSVAGLEAARERYGTRPRAALLAPAIALARDGFPLSEGDLALIRVAADGLAADPAARAIFLPAGRLPAPGEVLRQPDLAGTLDLIARDGADAFYRGPIGAHIVAASAANGGLLAAGDLERYAVRELPPVTCSYRGYLIHAAPPPSSGGVALCEILNIAEGFDLARAGFHGAEEVHALTEAMRLAYADRNTLLGDPDFVTNPVERLTGKDYARALRDRIPPGRAGANPLQPGTFPEKPQTTHYSVADAAGNAVAVTTTLNGWFGARRVAPGTGILLNNEMDDFTAKPGAPNMFGLVQGSANAVAPGKTPLSSMCPTVIDRDGRFVAVLGSPGGSRIITTMAETVINMVDHGMSLAEAVDAPRFHMQGLPDSIAAERFAFSPDTEAALRAMGYTLKTSGAWGMVAGILAGAPSLEAASETAHALSIQAEAPRALYGVMDARSPTGNAAGF